jgi:hypothetical protein
MLELIEMDSMKEEKYRVIKLIYKIEEEGGMDMG